ncbi:MAG: hypothetical protein ACIARR_00645 [Phycisphaerales bacterium JB059]
MAHPSPDPSPVTRQASVDTKALREQAIEHPLVKDALELLGGKIVRVELKSDLPREGGASTEPGT